MFISFEDGSAKIYNDDGYLKIKLFGVHLNLDEEQIKTLDTIINAVYDQGKEDGALSKTDEIRKVLNLGRG